MKNFSITEQSLQALIAYLASRPYSEVWQAIEVLKMLPEIKEEDSKNVR